jgi:hypothetical protein
MVSSWLFTKKVARREQSCGKRPWFWPFLVALFAYAIVPTTSDNPANMSWRGPKYIHAESQTRARNFFRDDMAAR